MAFGMKPIKIRGFPEMKIPNSWLVKIIENPVKNGGFHSHGGTLKWLVCNGKSESKMNDFLGYPYFRTPPYRKKYYETHQIISKIQVKASKYLYNETAIESTKIWLEPG